ncbi:MAG: PAS domain-containing protein [Cyanobacteria bacterium P01_F01_bin.4]
MVDSAISAFIGPTDSPPKDSASSFLLEVVNYIPGIVYSCQCDVDWTMDFISDYAETLTGYPASDFLGERRLTWASLIHPDDRAAIKTIVEHSVKNQRPFLLDYRIVDRNSAIRWVHEKGQAHYGENGNPVRLHGVIFDISDRKIIEGQLHAHNDALVQRVYERTEALKHSQDLLRQFSEQLPCMLYQFYLKPDGTTGFLYVSQGCYHVCGLTKVEIEADNKLGPWSVHPNDRESFEHSVSRSADNREPWWWEGRLEKPDGTYEWVNTVAYPERLTDGTTVWTGVLTNVTEQVKSAAQLRDQARLADFRASVDRAMTQSSDLRHMLTCCTQAAVDHLGAAFARVWSLNLDTNMLELEASAGLYTHIDGGHARVPVGQFKIGLIAQEQQPHLTNDVLNDPHLGDKAWAAHTGMVAFAGHPLIADGQLLGVIAMFARNPLDDSTLQAFEFAANEIALGIKRYQAEFALQQSESALQQKAQQLESTLEKLYKTQTQLVQQEKMSSLGQLVAGVAHEINNPVNFIYGNLNHAQNYTQDVLRLIQLYQQHYPEPVSNIADALDEIDIEFLITDWPQLMGSMRLGAERIQKIVKSLRNFSRMDESDYKSVDIHEWIDSTLMILQRRIKAKPNRCAIQVDLNYGNLPEVECYVGQLNQVFMNILSNAIDALDDHLEQIPNHQPTITISTAAQADSICIKIIDNGPGIAEADRDHLFNPFFTTKPVGKGTGLGLSISYQVITERHQGRLQCWSALGEGTTFLIEIPIRQVDT